jgi:hypothetical protein
MNNRTAKYALAYLVAFLTMTFIFVTIALVTIIMGYALISFLLWEFLAVNLSLWVIARVLICIGFVMGISFVFSKNGKEFVDEFVYLLGENE